MSAYTNYWQDCIGEAADECDLTLTATQLAFLAKAAKMGHECYGMAFYSPPDSDLINELEREWAAKIQAERDRYDTYVTNAKTAIKHALGLRSDAQITIGDYGEVLLHGGRTERIQ